MAGETNMKKVFESYQNYINNKNDDITDDESDFEIFSDDDDFELSFLKVNNDETNLDGKKDENDLTKLKQLAESLNILTGEDFLKKVEKISTDNNEKSSLTNMTTRDCKHLIIDSEQVSKEYPKKIAKIFKLKYNQLVDHLEARNESTQQQFERRLKLITNQISRSNDSSYLDKFNELINSMHESVQELKVNMKNYEILHQLFQKKD